MARMEIVEGIYMFMLYHNFLSVSFFFSYFYIFHNLIFHWQYHLYVIKIKTFFQIPIWDSTQNLTRQLGPVQVFVNYYSSSKVVD